MFVAGSSKNMPQQVRRALVSALATRLGDEGAEQWVVTSYPNNLNNHLQEVRLRVVQGVQVAQEDQVAQAVQVDQLLLTI